MPEYKKLAEILNTAKKEKGLLEKGSKLISAPQRYTMKKLAETLGANGDSEDSEKSSVAIVDKVQEKLGIPDSTATNAAKALGVAGLEVFADPTNFIPVGKLAKGAKMGLEAISPASLKSLKKLESAITSGALKVSPEVVEKLRLSLKEAGPKTIAEALPNKYEKTATGMFVKKEPQNFGKVINMAKDEPDNYGKVINMASEAPKSFGTVTNMAKDPVVGKVIVTPEGAAVRIDEAAKSKIDEQLLNKMKKGI